MTNRTNRTNKTNSIAEYNDVCDENQSNQGRPSIYCSTPARLLNICTEEYPEQEIFELPSPVIISPRELAKPSFREPPPPNFTWFPENFVFELNLAFA